MAKVYNYSDDSDDDEDEDDDKPVNSLRGKYGAAEDESDDGEIKDALIKSNNDAAINASKDIILSFTTAYSTLEENLGDDFLETEWIPPTVEKALEYKSSVIYRGGDASLSSAKLIKDKELGVGTNLYFQFLKSMSIGFFVMTIFALPSLALFYFGSGVPQPDRDIAGLYRFSLGNIGFDRTLQSYEQTSRCGKSSTAFSVFHAARNTTCVPLYAYSLPEDVASGAITICELLQILVFFITVVHLHRCSGFLEQLASKDRQLSVTDYSVMVSKLPPDCSEQELCEHFSGLYALAAVDWRKRSAVEETRPIEDSESLAPSSAARGGWVAECVVFRNIGKLIRRFRSTQHLMESLAEEKARMKMHVYGGATKEVLFGGRADRLRRRQLALFKRAERRLMKTAKKIDSIAITSKSAWSSASNNASIMNQSSGGSASIKASIKAAEGTKADKPRSCCSILCCASRSTGTIYSAESNNTNNAINNADSNASNNANSADNSSIGSGAMAGAKAVIGFICFEYNESFARCMEDYAAYNAFPYSLLTWLLFPAKLKFKGCRIKVERAPEPDQIIWENLEVPRTAKHFRRFRTGLISVLLVASCFAVAVMASIYKSLELQSVPSASLCNTFIPQLYFGSNDANIASRGGALTPVVSDVSVLSKLNKQCNALVPDTFYAVYAVNTHVIGNYSFQACANTTANTLSLCPQYASAYKCPCLSTSSRQQCNSAGCSTGGGCVSFQASALGRCFCGNQLRSNGAINALRTLLASGSAIASGATTSDSQCDGFYRAYASVQLLSVLAALITAVVNTLLKLSLRALTLAEAHSTFDHQNKSLVRKIFAASFVNMAITALIAFGTARNVPDMLAQYSIFQGPYSDFSSGWYGNVGFILMITFILSAFVPILQSVFSFYISVPITRTLAHYAANRRTLKFATQHSLNMKEVGREFDSTTTTALLLALLFFAMMYGPGLPLLTPLCGLAFALHFRRDKLLVCRHSRKPPFLGDAVFRLVLSVLPYAAALRLCVACWMFSARNVLTSTFPTLAANEHANAYLPYLTQYLSLAEQLQRANLSFLPESLEFLQQRVCAANVLPLFAVFCGLVCVQLCVWLWRLTPMYLLSLLWAVLARERRRSRAYKALAARRSEKTGRSDKASSKQRHHPWELVSLNDPLRKEAAPFTGSYFRYLCHKGEIPDTCVKMCAYDSLKKVSENDAEQGWEVADKGADFSVLVKKWQQTVMTSDGQSRMKGEHKKTYEVIADHRCSSYQLERIPAYRMAAFALKGVFGNRSALNGYVPSYEKAAKGVGAGETAVSKAAALNRTLKNKEEKDSDDDEEEDDEEGKKGMRMDQKMLMVVSSKPKAPAPSTKSKGGALKVVPFTASETKQAESDEDSDDSSGSYETDSEEDDDDDEDDEEEEEEEEEDDIEVGRAGRK